VLRLARPRRKELKSKGEMRGTDSRGLWGASGTGKGRSTAVATLGETTMERVVRSKGKEGRRGSRGVVEAEGEGGGA
jgi:hypothetical protein